MALNMYSVDKPKLFPYQEGGVEFLLEKRRCILADDMGLGKTAQCITAADRLGAKRVLIVCPNTLKSVWETELEKWLDTKDIEVVKSPDFFERECQIKSSCRFTIINYECLGERITRHEEGLIVTDDNKHQLEQEGKIEIDKRHLPTLRKIKWDLIICDEAHRIKNPKTHSFKALSNIIITTMCPNLFLVTGTPILNRTDEVWTLLHLIDPGKYTSFYRWKKSYDSFPYRVRQTLEPILLRRLKKEVLNDLPDKYINNMFVEMEDWQEGLYAQMRDDMYVELAGKEIDAVCLLAQYIRLKQMCVSPDLLNPETEKIRGAKIDALEEIIDDSGDRKIVVFSQFSTAIDRLRKKFEKQGIKCAGFTGATPERVRKEEIEKFQNDSSIKLFLTTIQSGGLGITLTSADIGVFLDLVWTPAINGQASDRMHRIGQKNNVTIYNLTIERSIESYILMVLREKEDLFNTTVPVSEIGSKIVQGFKNKSF